MITLVLKTVAWVRASWHHTATVQEVVREVGDPGRVVLDVYFRQPFVLDEESGLRGAGEGRPNRERWLRAWRGRKP